MEKYRKEKDSLGEREIPASSLYGIHTLRAIEKFPLSCRCVHPVIIRAYGAVKLSYARTNMEMGAWELKKFNAIEAACVEMMEAKLDKSVIVDALHGGGAALDMNINETLANRVIELLGGGPGDYALVSPCDDLMMRHSHEEAYPLALNTAVVSLLRVLERESAALVDSFREMGKQLLRESSSSCASNTNAGVIDSNAEAFSANKWNIHALEGKFRVHPLFYSVSHEITPAARQFVLRSDAHIKDITGYELSREESPQMSFSYAEVFNESCDILDRYAACIQCAAADIASGGLRIKGVKSHLNEHADISEAAAQAAISSMGNICSIKTACANMTVWPRQLLPLVADSLLNCVDLLCNAAMVLRRSCLFDSFPLDE